MHSCGAQVGAFKDYTPGAAPAAAAEPEEKAEQAPAEEEAPAEAEDGGGGGGGGDYPPHSVMGLPALSPTMSQGALPACMGAPCLQLHCKPGTVSGCHPMGLRPPAHLKLMLEATACPWCPLMRLFTASPWSREYSACVLVRKFRACLSSSQGAKAPAWR